MRLYKYISLKFVLLPLFLLAFASSAVAQQYSQTEKDLIREYEAGTLQLTTEGEKQIIQNYLNAKNRNWLNRSSATPGRLNVINEFFFDDFEDNSTYDDWTIEDLEGGFPWDFGAPYEPAGTLDGSYMYVDSDGAGSDAGRILTTITSPAIDLTGYTGEGLYLYFDHHYLQLSDQTGRVQVSTDSTTWTTIEVYNTDQGETDFDTETSNGVGEVLSLAEYDDSEELYVRFEFDDNGGWTWFWFIDNVRVFESEPPATLAFSPAEVDFGTLFTGSADSITVDFQNDGFARLELSDITTPAGVETSETSLSIIPGNTSSVTFSYEATATEVLEDSIFITTNVDGSEELGIPVRAESIEPLTNLFEDFEGLDGTLPGLWSFINFSVAEGLGVDGSDMIRSNQWVLIPETEFETPFIDLSDATNPLLSFDYRVTDWVESGPPTTPTPAGAFEIELLVVNDDGSTDLLETIGEGNHEPSLDYATVVIDLSEYAGQAIAFRMDSEYIGGDFNLDVDNVLVGDPPDGATQLASISTEEINFDQTIIGAPNTETVVISNDGIVPVTISSVFLSAPFTTDFAGETTISVGESLAIDVTFDPDAAGAFQEDLIIETSAADFIVLLQGEAVEAPTFTVGSAQISNSVTVGVDGDMLPGENNVGLELINEGSGPLQYSIPAFSAMMALENAGTTRNNSNRIEFNSVPERGQKDLRVGHPVVLGAGGPDDFGYYWVDSNEGFGPVFSWIDAAGNGTVLSDLSGTEDGNTTVSLPFDFPYNGETLTEITVSVNGWLSVDDFDGWGNINKQIPSADGPNGLIAALWDDLTAENGGGVYTYENDGRFVIEWNGLASVEDNSASYTFQTILHEDGTVQFQYKTLEGPVNTSTTGIEGISGETGLQIAFNTAYLAEGLAIAVSNAPQFITDVVPAMGTVEPGSQLEVFIQIDMSGFSEGTYTEELVILTNDPDNPRETVEVVIEVAGTPELVVLEELEFAIEEIPFGDVFVGNSVFSEIQIANIGSGSFMLSDISLSGDAFEYTIGGLDQSEVELPLTLAPNEFIPVEITFTPSGLSSYSGELIVETDNGQQQTISLTGSGTQPPSASVDIEGFDFNVSQGDVIDTTFTLTNLEKTLLEFDVTFSLPDDEEPAGAYNTSEISNDFKTFRSQEEIAGLNLSAARLLSDRSERQNRSTPERQDNHYSIIWDNPVAGEGGIVSSDFSPISTPIYSAGNFSVVADVSVNRIFAPGFNSGGAALTPAGNPSLNFYIYEDDGGKPAGNPSDGADSYVWSYSTTVDGDGVTITNSSEITLDILEATGESAELAAGNYWLIVVPEANTANLGGPERWNWFQGSPVGFESLIIDPTDAFEAGFTDWTGLGTAIGDWTHLAFTLEGEIDFPLSLNPQSGTVEGGPENAQLFNLRYAPEEAGTFEYTLEIATNDPSNPVISIPIMATVEETADGPARLQVIHNAADPAAELVDVFVNGELLLEEFAFRSATPFMDVPADTELELDVAISGTGIEESFYNTTVTLEPEASYTVVANGLAETGFLDNPEGENTEFDLVVLPNAREQAEEISDVDLRLFHGVTDAPALDVLINLPDGGTVEVDDFGYGDYTDYLTVDPDVYSVDLLSASTESLLFTHTLDLSDDDAFAATVIASGFVNSNANNRGPEYELMIVYENGSIVLTDGVATSIGESLGMPREFGLNQNYPNPFNPTTQISYNLPSAEMVTLEVYDMIGRRVATLVNTEMAAGTHQATFDASNLSSGVYLYRLQAGSFVRTEKMMLIK